MITLEKALDMFLMDQELKGNTEKTIKNYRSIVGYFIKFMENKGIHEVTLADIKNYQFYLMGKNVEYTFAKTTKEKKLSKKTVQTYIRHVRVFLNWANEELEIESIKIKLPKAPQKAIEILSDEEIQVIYKAINDRLEIGLRNKCIISLMLDSGLRCDEVITLNLENIHFTQNVIKVDGKGEKERIIPLGLYTKKLLFKYIHGYRPIPANPSNRIFLSIERNPITMDAIKMIFQRLKKKVDIPRLKPHLLRHTFATKYLMSGGDLFSLQMILGHSSLEMTRMYSHLAGSYSVRNFYKLSTLDRLKGRSASL